MALKVFEFNSLVASRAKTQEVSLKLVKGD